MLYIAGLGRSGSTLLDRLLGEVPGHVSTGELVNIWSHGVIEDRPCSCGRSFSECSFWREVKRQAPGVLGHDMAAEIQRFHERELRSRLIPRLLIQSGRQSLLAEAPRGYFDELEQLYHSISAAADGAVVVDSSKHPSYLYLISSIASISLTVLHLTRDPRAVAYSWQRIRVEPGHPQREYMHTFQPWETAFLWDLWNVATERLSRQGAACRQRLRYEDLVSAPRQCVGALSNPEPSMSRATPQTRHQSGHSLSGNPMRFEQGPIRVQDDDEWSRLMTGRQQLLVTALTSPFLRRFGYRLKGPRA